MKVNYVLMYGMPYLKYKEFETFEDVSKFLVGKGIVNYSIFKKLEDGEEIEMIYRDNDINYLKKIIKEVREEVRIYEEQSNDGATNELDNYVFVQRLKNVLDKENKQ